jgi:diketogulonate reductase-like aldo/keto reductase
MKFDSKYKLNNGVLIPVIGYGTWRLPNTLDTAQSVAFAIKQGYRLIDTASIYQNQQMVGKGIKDSGIDRKELFITSKL